MPTEFHLSSAGAGGSRVCVDTLKRLRTIYTVRDGEPRIQYRLAPHSLAVLASP